MFLSDWLHCTTLYLPSVLGHVDHSQSRCERVCCSHLQDTPHTIFVTCNTSSAEESSGRILTWSPPVQKSFSLVKTKEHSIACYREATKTGQAPGVVLNISAIETDPLLVDQPMLISRRRFVYIGIETNCVVSIPSWLAHTATINHAASSVYYKTKIQENRNYQVE